MIQGQITMKWILLIVSVSLAVGCAEKTNTSSVTGHVTLDGVLLDGGNITFHPTAGGVIAYSRIDAKGSYSLRVGSGKGTKDALPEGQYKVTVIFRLPPTEGLGERGGPPDVGASLIPDKYQSKRLTPFTFEVKKGSNLIDLKLERDEEVTSESESDGEDIEAEKQEETADGDSTTSEGDDTESETEMENTENEEE